MLDGHVVARGRLVAVGDEFGVLVTQIAKPARA
jgi:flagellar motor switch/type III secretory pathway protein FliN